MVWDNLSLNADRIDAVKKEAFHLVTELLQNDLVEAILYGSCARGDYTEDSDIDIALLTKCDRMEAKRYGEGLAEIATKLAMKYFVVVNFACLPFDDFTAKKTWYGFYRNIDSDGKVLNPEI